MNIISKQTFSLCILLTLTACASVPDTEESVAVATPVVAATPAPTKKVATVSKKPKKNRVARKVVAKTRVAKSKARTKSLARGSVQQFAKQLEDKDDLWSRIREGYALQAHDNIKVNRAVERFVRSPSYFRDISNRASPFLYHIVEEIEQRGMPMELAFLPAIESAFQPGALSPKRAAGIWQFTLGTARNFGLQLNSWYDGRRDVVASTTAALDYLQKLHQDFGGDWLTALAAYNFGEGNVRKAINRNRNMGRPTDFWSLDLPRETREYIPSLLAFSRVIAKPQEYGVSLRPIEDSPQIEHIEIGTQIDLTVAARLAGLSPNTLKRLNPGYRHSITAPEGPFGIALPVDKADDFKRRLADLSAEQLVSRSARQKAVAEAAADKGDDMKPLPEEVATLAASEVDKNALKVNNTVNTQVNTQQHRIAQGETLEEIAKQYETTIDALRTLNQSLNERRLQVGDVLQVPAKQQDKNKMTQTNSSKTSSNYSS